ncbi:MAG: 50S ribosomal protein L9 [Spirochaetaceae bacterium]|jgi:large subunit ribosomal protein L9|nr:50S ribosomal protein L9 [Spirochaetaceae bacterium]
MKVILNQDLAPLGEEGDVKDVAKGYYRNYLGPRNIAVPYNEETVKIFEARKDQIEARKALKRQDAASVKARLEEMVIEFSLPAGPNGKLYGAVTSQTIIDELSKQGYVAERKRIEIPGNVIKSTGKHKVIVKLYEGATAEVTVTVKAQESSHTEQHAGHERKRKTAEEKAENVAPAEEQVVNTEEASAETEAPVAESESVEAPAE